MIHTDIHCLPVSLTLSFLFEAIRAMPTKNGSEKIMRSVSNVKASTVVSAKAFFTMIALVENNTAPRKVIIKPPKEIVYCKKSFSRYPDRSAFSFNYKDDFFIAILPGCCYYYRQ